MEIKRSNLFIGNRSFGQSWALRFNENRTENQYTSDSTRFHSQSLQFLYIWGILFLLFLYFSSQIPLFPFTGSALLYAVLPLVKNQFLKRTITQAIIAIWQITGFTEGSLCECFGILLPSCISSFFLVHSWLKSLPFFFFDFLVINSLKNDVKFNLLLSVVFYLVVLGTLEKDFRDIWHLYSSFKKSNCLNKALWDYFAGVELLVNTDGRIIYYNKCAVKLMEKLKRPKEILKNGKFLDLFPDFQDAGKVLLQKSIKGELHEEIHSFKYLDDQNQSQEAIFMITADLFSWFSGNCSRIVCLDVTGHASKKMMVLACLKEIDSYMDYLNKKLIQMFIDKTVLTKEFVTIFYRVLQQFMGIEAIQSHFSGEILLVNEKFDVNAELMNTVELVYLKCSNHNVSVTYTKDQAVPACLIGDKVLHNVIVFFIIDFTVQNSIDGSDVFIYLQVVPAGVSTVMLNYKFSFFSEKVTPADIDNLFSVKKEGGGVRDLNDFYVIYNRFGSNIASLDTILLALGGYSVPTNSEVCRNRITINICIPFSLSTENVESFKIQISKSVIQDTPLTVKWKPDLGIYQKAGDGDYNILKDQVALVNSRSKFPKILIQSGINLEIKPEREKKIEKEEKKALEFSLNEVEILEENDANDKIKDYSNSATPVMKKIFSPVIRMPQGKVHSDPVILISDESGETRESISRSGAPENLIVYCRSTSESLGICESFLSSNKKIIFFLFPITRSSEKDTVSSIRDIENKYKCEVPLCGMSSIPADLNYCKLLDIKHFMVKPISYSQILALMKKLDPNTH